MNHIDYFKLQAKNLFKDFKTQQEYFDEAIQDNLYRYTPKYFDIDEIVLSFDINEAKFTLMNAQHYIALIAGFNKWGQLIKAPEQELKLARLLFENQNLLSLDDWHWFLSSTEEMNNMPFSLNDQIALLEHLIKDGDKPVYSPQGFTIPKEKRSKITSKSNSIAPKVKKGEMITELPLSKALQDEFIESANRVFKGVLFRIQAEDPQSIRDEWDARDFVNNYLLDDSMLPISKDDALSLIDALLVHYVIGLNSVKE